MKRPMKLWVIWIIITHFAVVGISTALAGEFRTVEDMRGRKVSFPANLKKVATIDDGFVEGVMTSLGVIKSLAATSSRSLRLDFPFEYETASGERFSHCGFNTIKTINPWLDDLPSFRGIDGMSVVNFEALAKVEPELVIMRVGDCTMGTDNEKIIKAIVTIEALGFPLLVLHSPSYQAQAELASIFDEITLLGEVFDQRERAGNLIAKLSEIEKMVQEKTAGTAAGSKPTMLYLGLNPDFRKRGAVGSVYGINTPESYIIEKLANARNAFQNKGTGLPLSTEQIYALDPDVIVLPAANGYHPPRELYEATYFADLSELKAVKNRQVYAMPFTPYNCSRRLEYPLDILVIAKAAYPERFQDFSVYDFALKFYQDIYGIDREMAERVRSSQLLDWMGDEKF